MSFSPLRNPWIRYTLPALAWAGGIIYLLLLPSGKFPEVPIWSIDKIAHIGLFFVQALLNWRILRYQQPFATTPRKAALYAIVLTIVFGAASEVMQGVFTERTADVYDAAANAIGCVLIIPFMRVAAKMFPRRKPDGASRDVS